MKDFNFYLEQTGEIGLVESVSRSIVWVTGLPQVRPEEMVLLETGELGQALFLRPDKIEVLLFSEAPIKVGTRVVRTGERLSVPVGRELLGQVVNSLCRPLEFKGSYHRASRVKAVSKDLLGIEKRASVCRCLETGVTLVDLLIPLGCGQRELIIGDRKTGKTAFLFQTVVTQAKKGTVCLYVIIGKKRNDIKEAEEFFRRQGVMNQVIIMASSAQDPTGLIYLAPYTALTVAEFFKDQGINTLVILDDLTFHAKFYREITLLSKRFPGRGSYPTDIFFAHAGILEKGGNFKAADRETSITILPVAETTEGDFSGYIQTNLMAMTDGHLYFDKDLFAQGRRPAINPFLSVTRVGRQAQTSLMRQVGRELLAFLTHWEKMQSYVHFGTELTEEAKTILDKGQKIISFFEQRETELAPSNVAVFLIACLWQNFWPGKTVGELKTEWRNIIEEYKTEPGFRKIVDKIIKESKEFPDLLKRIQSANLQVQLKSL
jgi:F-type H+-transporting ATPase subunit alpha